MRVAVLTVSDATSRGERADGSGDAVVEFETVAEQGTTVVIVVGRFEQPQEPPPATTPTTTAPTTTP